jgi:hypothetical protein
VSDNDMRDYNELASRFITLANQMKDEGKPINMVNASLMSASCFYATYTAAGDNGGLTASGIEKVVETYKANLESVQKYKTEQANNP